MAKFYAVLAVIICISCSSFAMPVIEVGTVEIAPNGFGVLEVMVSGDDYVQGLNFNIQIADGGPQLDGIEVGPTIFTVSIIADTIFAGNNTGQIDVLDFCNPSEPDCLSDGTPAIPQPHDQLWVAQTTTSTGFVQAGDGQGGPARLATVFFDAAGFTTGSWEIKLTGTLNGDTDFAGVPIDITNGLLCIEGSCCPCNCLNECDINCDGEVSLLDLDILGRNWRKEPATPDEGDIDGDGRVGLTDLDLFGQCWYSRAQTQTPEPASLGLMILTVAYTTRRR